MAGQDVEHPWRILFALIAFTLLLWIAMKLELNAYISALIFGLLSIPLALIHLLSIGGVPKPHVWMGTVMMSAMFTSFLLAVAALEDLRLMNGFWPFIVIPATLAIIGNVTARVCLSVARRYEQHEKE